VEVFLVDAGSLNYENKRFHTKRPEEPRDAQTQGFRQSGPSTQESKELRELRRIAPDYFTGKL
jgi:hypothetical protein